MGKRRVVNSSQVVHAGVSCSQPCSDFARPSNDTNVEGSEFAFAKRFQYGNQAFQIR